MTQPNLDETFFGGIYPKPYYSHPPSKLPGGEGIYEDPDTKLIFIPIAGYTKPVTYHPGDKPKHIAASIQTWNGINRQEVILQARNSLELGIVVLPIETDSIKIELIDEPENKHDNNAILIIGSINDVILPLGYIPGRITKWFKDKRDWINERKIRLILKPIEASKKNYILPYLVIPYEKPDDGMERFSHIQL